MKYKMRKLKTADIFKMSKILKKLDLKLSDVNIEEGATQTQAGIAIIQKALENLHRAEDEVNEFLGDLVGISGEEFGELDIEDAISIIMLFKEQKGVANFFEQSRAIDEITVIDLLLSRYNNIDYVFNLDFVEGIHLINKAIEKSHEEKMFKLYSSAYPHFSKDNFKTWEEFYIKPNVNTQPAKRQSVDEILLSVKETIESFKKEKE